MTPAYNFAIQCMCNSFSDNAKSIKNLYDDLSKALEESEDCYFDYDLNAVLENCTEPWNVSTYFMLHRTWPETFVNLINNYSNVGQF